MREERQRNDNGIALKLSEMGRNHRFSTLEWPARDMNIIQLYHSIDRPTDRSIYRSKDRSIHRNEAISVWNSGRLSFYRRASRCAGTRIVGVSPAPIRLFKKPTL